MRILYLNPSVMSMSQGLWNIPTLGNRHRVLWKPLRDLRSGSCNRFAARPTQQGSLRGRYRPSRSFAGAPDMFLPRVPPHTPVTVGRQKHIGPANCLSCGPAHSARHQQEKEQESVKRRRVIPAFGSRQAPCHENLPAQDTNTRLRRYTNLGELLV